MVRLWALGLGVGLVGVAACGAAPEPARAPSPAEAPPAASQVTPPAQASAPVATATAVAEAQPPPASAAPTAPPAPAAAPSPPPIPKGTAVLLIGDSFALAGFSKALKPRMVALGARYEVRAETSSFTTTWSSKMEQLVSNTQPDLVIINLGANEVANTDPPAHAPAVRKIVRAIGDRPCVWVAPPLWKKDTGITDVIRENSAPCRFYDSTALVGKPIPRQGDHIHPNDEGGAIWADAFWAWLNDQRDGAAPEGGKLRPWHLKAAPAGEHGPASDLQNKAGDSASR